MRLILSFLLAGLLTQTLAEPLVVITFNVRYPNPDDGENYWENRKDFLVDVIDRYNPALMGTQELFQRQGDYIIEKLPRYKWLGRDRRGGHEDEHMGIFYDPSRVELVESGDFWLSKTPNKVGSESWDVSLPRMVSWAKFNAAGGGGFYFLNTHFPHRREDEQARRHAARVIVEQVRAIFPAEAPIVLTGDFNAPGGEEVWRELGAEFDDARDLAQERRGPAGTSSGFEGRIDGRRIDWILLRGPWKASSVETVVVERDGRYPSDHFPVVAVIELP